MSLEKINDFKMNEITGRDSSMKVMEKYTIDREYCDSIKEKERVEVRLLGFATGEANKQALRSDAMNSSPSA